jgi:purine nucleosidase
VAAGLLGLADRAEVEVCVGAERPALRGEDRFNWFDHEPDCVVPGRARISEESGPARIVRATRERRDLEIVAVGPLTTLAHALALDPGLPGRVAGLTVMGGHVREAKIGSWVCEPGIDYNLCSDPEASMAVLGAGFDTTLVTADVTLRTWLRDRDVERLDGAGALARELARQVRIWKPVQHRIFEGLGGELEPDNAAYLHDPLTLLALIDAAPLEFERLRIVPTIEAGVFRTREAAHGLGAEMRVATGVDAAAAERAIVERLLQL